MDSLLSKEDLEIKFRIPDFVLKTQQQIAKDFQLSGEVFPADFSMTEKNLEQIRDEMLPFLENISRSGERKLLQLLYQIDIPQQQFLALTGESDFLSQLAVLIIRREAYKVYLRSKF